MHVETKMLIEYARQVMELFDEYHGQKMYPALVDEIRYRLDSICRQIEFGPTYNPPKIGLRQRMVTELDVFPANNEGYYLLTIMDMLRNVDELIS